MLTLVTYPAAFGEPAASPFCTKAMCLLQLAGVDWQAEDTPDPRKAPKAKLPVLKDGDKVIPDSEQIREHLEAHHGADFTKGLDADQIAVGRAVSRMVEEHLYFAIVCDRWMEEANWAVVREEYFGQIPALFRGFVTRLVRKQALRQVHNQGMGRHSAEERFARARHDIAAVTQILGDKPFLFGDAPTAADASAVAMLGAAAAAPVPTPTSRLVNEDPMLSAYLQRGREAMYPPGR